MRLLGIPALEDKLVQAGHIKIPADVVKLLRSHAQTSGRINTDKKEQDGWA